MTLTILITRPEPEASRFADRLRADHGPGVAVLCAPLMRTCWTGELPALSGAETLIFTSRHGVAGFCRQSDRRDLPGYAVGPATARAAHEAGLSAVACGGDAGALLQRIAEDGARGPFLHARGAHVAADIAGALRAAGKDAAQAVVYEQTPLPLSDAARTALAGTAPVVVPVMSPRSGRLLMAALRTLPGRPAAPLFFAAISRNAAQTIPAGTAVQVRAARLPDAQSVRNLVRDMVKDAKRLEGGKRAQ